MKKRSSDNGGGSRQTTRMKGYGGVPTSDAQDIQTVPNKDGYNGRKLSNCTLCSAFNIISVAIIKMGICRWLKRQGLKMNITLPIFMK